MVSSKNKLLAEIDSKKRQSDREKRLSTALRDNLRKRKTQKLQRSNVNLES